MLPALCVGLQITQLGEVQITQNFADLGERPHKESQLMSLKLKSPSSIRSLVALLKDSK